MKRLLFLVFTGLFLSTTAGSQAMPASITGRWRIVKLLPTKNPQCWDAERAQSLVGSTLLYQPHLLTWQGGPFPISEALSRTLNRREFQQEYKVDLPELDIRAASVTEIDLQHEDADFTGATTEVPGDTVLLAGPNRIVISACGVFYSAVRASAKDPGGR